MTTAFAVQETIERPIEEVWEILTDWDRAPEWMRGIDGFALAGPTDVGSELTFRARGKERTSRITALTPGRSVTLTSTQGRVTAAYRYECEPVGDATRVSLTADCRTQGPVLAAIAPLLRWAVRRTDGGQLVALRRVAESGV